VKNEALSLYRVTLVGIRQAEATLNSEKMKPVALAVSGYASLHQADRQVGGQMGRQVGRLVCSNAPLVTWCTNFFA